MLITIGLFLAIVLLLLIGYIGEVVTSMGDESQEEFVIEHEQPVSASA